MITTFNPEIKITHDEIDRVISFIDEYLYDNFHDRVDFVHVLSIEYRPLNILAFIRVTVCDGDYFYINVRVPND